MKSMTHFEAITLIKNFKDGPNGMRLCDDDGSIGNFSNAVLEAKMASKDFEFFQSEYIRFITRIEGMGLGFIKGDDKSFDSEIDFDLIDKVCHFIQDMPTKQKDAMLEDLKIYRVRSISQP